MFDIGPEKMMKTEVGRQPNLRDEPLSDCRSFGSNCHPSSQSRKISIGVMVNSPANGRSRGTKELKFMGPNADVPSSSLENSMQRSRKENDTGIVDTDRKSKLSEAPQQVSSPWISTRSLNKTAPVVGSVSGVERVSHSQTSCGRQNNVHGASKAPATYSIRCFANQSSIFESGNSKEKNFDEVSYEMEGGKGGTTERLHEFAFATTEDVRSDKVVIEDQANKSTRRTEMLKMKLQEILGTGSSHDEQHSKCLNHEQHVNHLITEQIFVQKHDSVVRFRQNSDTIETDSESLNQILRRPIVRSITGKRSRTTLQSSKTKAPSCDKQKHQNGNSFVFEGWPGSTRAARNGASPMFTRKKSGKSSECQPRKLSFPDKDDGTAIFPKPAGTETLATGENPPVKKPSSLNEALEFRSSPSKHDKGLLGTDEENEKKEFNRSPQTNKTELPGDLNNPADFDQQGDPGNSFLKYVDPQSHIESPTFRMKTPVCSSPSSSKTDKMVNDSSPGPAEEMFVMRDTCSFRNLQTSEGYCRASNAKSMLNFSDDDKEIEHSPPRNAATSLSERVADYRSSDSSSEDTSSVEVSSQRDTSSPEIGAIKNLKAMLHPAKRTRSLESHECDFFRPGESSWTEEILVQNQEDGLARAVKLFLSELEKLKSKIISVSIEKSSEILLSVAESIHSQLQNVESQIQMDMVKLFSLGKSRRKILEARLEEQQEQLKNIHKKFKEEVNQHLQDSRSSLQELEAQQIEFKGIIEKKKASNRNTLLQVEEAVDMLLNDAQKKIEAIHECGRGKMLQLKHVIAMCLK